MTPDPNNQSPTPGSDATAARSGVVVRGDGKDGPSESHKFAHFPGLLPQQRAFLAAFAMVGVVTRAAEIAQIARRTHYDWLEGEEYARAFVDATEAAGDFLEHAAWKLANEGWFEPVYQGGEQVGSKWKFSESLLALLLKGSKPDKFRDNAKIEHAGAVSTNPVLILPPDGTESVASQIAPGSPVAPG